MLWSDRVECLWEEALPIEVKELPDDLSALDRVLSDPELLMPVLERFRREVIEDRRAVLTDRRPTIAIETFIRLMVLKARYRWRYRTLVAEVSDSIHLRRFCRISLSERVPDESTVRKLTRRLGPETVSEISRSLIVSATRQRRFRVRAVRIDSTVVAADVKYPTDSGLASHGVRALAREGRKLAKLVGETKRRVRDRSRSIGRRLRAITRTIRRRSGEAKAEVLALTEQTGELLERSVKETGRLVAIARRRARGRGASAKLKAANRLGELADRCEKVAGQIKQRVAGEPISDRIISLSDPDARPIRKGQAWAPERVWVCDPVGGGDREHRVRRARADPARLRRAGEPGREHAAARDRRRAETPRAASAGGSARWWVYARPDEQRARGPGAQDAVHRWPPRARVQTHQRRMGRYRTGEERRISQLKRRYGLDRTRLKGDHGQQIWTEWGILAYNSDTLAIRTK
jgi:IS5 family transposase